MYGFVLEGMIYFQYIHFNENIGNASSLLNYFTILTYLA